MSDDVCSCGHCKAGHYLTVAGEVTRCRRAHCGCEVFTARQIPCACGDCLTCELRAMRQRHRARRSAA